MDELKQLASTNRNVTLFRLLSTLRCICTYLESLQLLENTSEFIEYREETIQMCNEIISEHLQRIDNLSAMKMKLSVTSWID